MTIFRDFQGPRPRRDIDIARPRHSKTCLETRHPALPVTPKCLTSGGAHLRGLAPGQHSSEKRCSGGESLASGDTVFDLTGQRIEPKISRIDSNVITTELPGRLNIFKF